MRQVLAFGRKKARRVVVDSREKLLRVYDRSALTRTNKLEHVEDLCTEDTGKNQCAIKVRFSNFEDQRCGLPVSWRLEADVLTLVLAQPEAGVQDR